VLNANTPKEIDAAFAQVPQAEGCGIVFGPEGFLYVHRAHIAELALSRKLPTIFDVRNYVEAGGLTSYGSDYYQRDGDDRRLRRACIEGREARRPAVQQATKFEMVLNRKTAKALGMEISPTVLATANNVIERSELCAGGDPLS
jgi:putative tryptophan/tyrosine transport system substrate-binding protein